MGIRHRWISNLFSLGRVVFVLTAITFLVVSLYRSWSDLLTYEWN